MRGGVIGERDPGYERLHLAPHLLELLVERVDRRSQRMEQLSLVACRTRFQEHAQLAVQLRDVVERLGQGAVLQRTFRGPLHPRARVLQADDPGADRGAAAVGRPAPPRRRDPSR